MAPESRRAPLRVLAFAAWLLILGAPAHALRIVDYNFLNFPGPSGPARETYFRTILQPISPDVIVAEEMTSQAGVDEVVNNILNVIEPGQWAALPFLDGNDTDCAFFYKPAKVTPLGQWGFYGDATLLRLIHVYRWLPVGYTSGAAEIRCYGMHLKASTGSANVARRLAEATTVRDSMNAMPPGTHAFAMGDFNFYTGLEPGMQKLIEVQANNVGQVYDPLGLQNVAWQDNTSMTIFHTQSPCLTGGAVCASGAATGGLDDRFDLILPTLNWNTGQGYGLVPGSYVSVGNDGQHLNLNITDPPTIPEGAAYAQALQLASDHLPVRLDLSLPAISSVASSLDLGTAIGSASASLGVSNLAVPPADGLTYTLSAPAGFAAPGGTLELAPGGSTTHTISTTPGAFGPRAGDLTMSSDDVDHPTRVVTLSANLLDHAHASLDSTVEQTSSAIDFGTLPASAFTTATIAVHNLGYGSLQAKLIVGSLTITGGDGHFSIVSQPPTQTVEDVGLRYGIAFDTTGATPDSQYTATLTIDSADEPLPGGQASPSLTVSLSATISSGPLAAPVGPGAPASTRLYSPFPNPVSFASTIHFDLAHRAPLKLDVIDLAGRHVATLANRTFEPGRYAQPWTGRDDAGANVPAGIYFVRLSGPDVPAQAVRFALVR